MGDLSNSFIIPFPLISNELCYGWEFKQCNDDNGDEWMLVQRVPSTVHQDLIYNKKLDDPFMGFNEAKAEWVGTKSWVYRKRFTCSSTSVGAHAVLAFEGLDTFANVKLNGVTILNSDNMFHSHRIDVTELIRTEDTDDNILEIEFESAMLKAREIQARHPEHKFICSNGEPARLAVRKAQYHWGWDWGPFLMCAGIWRPIRFETYTTRIAQLNTITSLSDDYSEASVKILAELEHHAGLELTAEIFVNLEGKRVARTLVSVPENGVIDFTFNLVPPRLWMPNGYGQQNLYVIGVRLRSRENNTILHTVEKRIGIRKIELVQEPDRYGKSFYFRVNGVDIFCGGSCWIPADSILTNVTPERYRSWLELMVPANQKMIRVWGGGIYEDDAFYDACDELGILVWQDFMFACGNYPTFPEMLESIRKEAIMNVERICHHPSLAIFAGNNEDYQIQEQNGLTYDFADKDEQHWLKTDFPARYIYESLLPKVMSEYAPSIAYHPGSPWGDGKATSDPSVGDMHQWNVWHGSQQKYQIFDTLGGRFNSEFGMEAFPHIATIRSFVENERDLYPQSHLLDFHNKADGHERRIATYLIENVRLEVKLEAYIHLTQLIQCEALMFGYRGWRKLWGDNRKCGGALVWQLNDCWPVTSWSICDYYRRRKPAYYAMARVLAPVAVGVKRAHHDWSVTHAKMPDTSRWEMWIVSSKLEAVTVDVELRFVCVETGRDVKDPMFTRDVRITPNGTTNIATGEIDNVHEVAHVLAARIFINGQVVARDTDWPQPLKYLSFPDRNVRVEANEMAMLVSVDRPVKSLVFEEREGCDLSDSALDVIPGDDQLVTVRGLQHGDKPLSWTYLGESEQ